MATTCKQGLKSGPIGTALWVAALMLGVAATGPAPSAEAGAVLDRIVSEKKIRLGVRNDAPPFAELKGDKLVGFSVELCSLVANTIVDTSGIDGLTGTVVQVSASDRFEKLASNEIDLLCGATTATSSRREIMSFSIPTFITGIGAVVRNDAPDLLKEVLITTSLAATSQTVVEAGLKGTTLGVHSGTTAETWLKANAVAGIEGVTIMPVDSHFDGLDRVTDGTLDAYFADRAILIGVDRERGQGNLEISRKTYTLEPYALALPKGDEELRLLIDRALSHLYRSGRVFKVFQRHFGKPTQDVVQFYTSVSLPD